MSLQEVFNFIDVDKKYRFEQSGSVIMLRIDKTAIKIGCLTLKENLWKTPVKKESEIVGTSLRFIR